MKKLSFLVIAVSLFTLTGCSSKLEKNMDKVIENSSTYYDSYQEVFNKEVEIAKNYEMNAILSLRSNYNWNFYNQGEVVDESETVPLGVYSQDALYKVIGLSKEQVIETINTKNSNRANGEPVYTPTIDEKLAIASISISYYLSTEDSYESFGASANGVDGQKNVMQVVTITTDYGVYESCFVWRDGKVVNNYVVNNF
jgi:hypothetical protein